MESIHPTGKYRVAIDLAKYVFQVCVATEAGKQIMNKKMNQKALIDFFYTLPPETPVTMEACGMSNFWARYCNNMGLHAQLINPLRTKAFLSGKKKTDKNDALAILEASQADATKFVRVKTVSESTIGHLIEIRKSLVHHKIDTANQLRSLIGEHGIVVSQGHKNLLESIQNIVDEYEQGVCYDEMPGIFICELKSLKEILDMYDNKISEITDVIEKEIQENIFYKQLKALPGYGDLTVASVLCQLGNGDQFKNGRMFSAWVGLTPGEYSSGGKQRLGPITRHGNKTLRTLMVTGAISCINGLQRRLLHGAKTMKFGSLDLWVKKLLDAKQSVMKVAVALANKLARIAWAIVHNNATFDTNKACGLCASQEEVPDAI